MAESGRITQAAHFLVEAHDTRRQFGGIPGDIGPQDEAEAYAVQDAFCQLLAAKHGPVAGYKIALTTAVMQKMVGYGEPVFGTVLRERVYVSPHTEVLTEHGHLGVECEIAVMFGADLVAGGVPFSREQVAGAVEAVMPAYELIDDRNAVYGNLGSDIYTFIGDNAWNAGIVLGQPVTDWRALDLAAAHGTLSLNGEAAGEGYGRDVLGHPLDALTWLANALSRRGKQLSRGMVVITGSIIATKFPAAGDELRYVLEGFGDVRVTLK